MMYINVHLTRKGDESWGFRLIGGVDFNMPLTIVKVLPNSPADRAGLRNGDSVSSIDGEPAADMCHEDSRLAVAAAEEVLRLGVTRGLYDPVLDEYEPIYDTIDQDDFDQPSDPTEVHLPDPKDITDLLIRPPTTEPEFGPLNPESRSLTASPFVMPTKPYRPFSTEPIETLPPLEEPIILNPDYNDDFSKLGIDEDFLPKTRFKLPISEQYDPDGTKKKGCKTDTDKIDIKPEKTTETNTEMLVKETTQHEIMTKEEITFLEKIKSEIDLENIELTATSIVDESLHKATSVAEDIKKEIAVALHETVTSESKSATNLSVQEHSLKENLVTKDDSTQISKLVEIIDKTTDELVKQNDNLDVNVTKQIEHFETINKNKAYVDEKKMLEMQEISQTIESGTVKKKTVGLQEKEMKTEQKDIRHLAQESKSKVRETRNSTQAKEEHATAHTKKTANQCSATKTKKDTKTSSSKRCSEQTAYILGLQTIPNIKGTIHSSYHFDMLLKTFFIHLTDVMVALSRFILSEPVSKKNETDEEHDEEESEEILTTTTAMEEQKCSIQKTESDIKSTQKDKEILYKREQQEIVAQSYKDDKVKLKKDMHIEKDYTERNISEESEKRLKSGLKMAQLVEKKSEEITHKMEAVISEFQDKAGIEEITNLNETSEEIKDESRAGRATYVAVVQSHVYTNEDTVFEDQVSETASFQSGEEVNTVESSKVECMPISNQITEKTAKTAENFPKQSHLTSIQTQEAAEKIEYQQKVDKLVADQTAIKHASEQIKEKIKETAANEKHIVTKSILKKTIDSANIQKASQDSYTENKIQESINVLMEGTSLQAVVEPTPIQESKFNDRECVIQEISLDNLAINDMVAEPIEEVKDLVVETCENKDKVVIEDYKAAIKEEEAKALAVAVTEVNAEMAAVADVTKKVENKCFTEFKKQSLETALFSNSMSIKTESDEFTSLKTAKEEVLEVSKAFEINDKTEIFVNKCTEINEFERKSYQSTQSNIEETKTDFQESTFVAKAVDSKESRNLKELNLNTETCKQKIEETKSEVVKSLESKDLKELKLDTSIAQQKSESQVSVQNGETTTPAPPTPLTDEYIFKLQIPFPKGITPVPPDPKSPTPPPEDEDPHIVKKNLIPLIETKIEDGIIYDPPLPTPPGSPKSPGSPTSNGCRPVYTKPGLRGGADREEKNVSKEEILEIERKSSLLASAIDQTIKSIEEYKEEVGIDRKKATTEINDVIYNGYAKVAETRVFQNGDYKSENDNRTEELISTTLDDVQNVSQEAEKNENGVKKESIEGYRPIQFDPAEIQDTLRNLKSAQYNTMIQNLPPQPEENQKQVYKNKSGEIIGTHQGIVDGLEEAVVDPKVEDELGKPGMTEEKIAELISGESEMLREAHVMGLTRVLTAHMHRENDDSSVDFKRIKPIVESLKDSEVLKALNEEFIKTQEEKKKEERKWTTFLQKPKRPVPKAKFGYYGYVLEESVEEPYKVKIVKQPKPKVAPDYKPEPEPSTVSVSSSPLHHHTIPSQKFETGLLPWEERALREPTPPPVAPEDPILVPEVAPEILEAVDPLPESEVPDLEDSGIPLPPPKEPTPPPTEEKNEEHEEGEKEEELDLEAVIEETEKIVEEKIVEEMEQNKIAEQLMSSVQNMVDPNAPLEQQLAQMRAQIAALAQLPCVIQQSLELVTKQLSQLSQLENTQTNQMKTEEDNVVECAEAEEPQSETTTNEEHTEEQEEAKEEGMKITEVEDEQEEVNPTVTAEEIERMKKEEIEMLDEQRRLEKQKKDLMEEARREIEARQLKHRPTPRVGKPKPVFGPATPQERPLVLPGGRKWRKPKDAYNEQFIRDVLASQAELIQGKTMGCSYESARLPYDERINFMKYEKPPVSLDHLQNSDTYKMIHNMEEKPLRRIDTLTPAISEADYRERCRSMTPCLAQEQHNSIPQQVQP